MFPDLSVLGSGISTDSRGLPLLGRDPELSGERPRDPGDRGGNERSRHPGENVRPGASGAAVLAGCAAGENCSERRAVRSASRTIYKM